MDDPNNELDSEENINVNCDVRKKIDAPHTQSYQFEKPSRVLKFKLRIDVNIYIDSEEKLV